MSSEANVSVRFDRYLGTLCVSFGDKQVTFDNLPETTEFLLAGDSDQDLRPVWVTQQEGDILAKMIPYILEKIRISAAAQQALTDVLPRVEEAVKLAAAGE